MPGDATGRIDLGALAASIERCFDLSLDDSVPEEVRPAFAAAGRRLRGLLLELASARLPSGDAGLQAASAQLTSCRDQLAGDLRDLARAQQILASVEAVIGALNTLTDKLA